MRPSSIPAALLVWLMVECCTPLPARPPRAERPSILFVLIKDMGFADLSVTGNDTIAGSFISQQFNVKERRASSVAKARFDDVGAGALKSPPLRRAVRAAIAIWIIV